MTSHLYIEELKSVAGLVNNNAVIVVVIIVEESVY